MTAANEGTAHTVGAIDGTISFLEVENISGTSTTADTLSAEGSNIWEITATNSVTLFDISFTGIEALIGNGNDALDYSAFAAPVTINLASATGNTGFTSISRFREVRGSAFDDTITGDAGDNILSGGDGNDTIDGGGGDDFIVGEAGDDTLDGQAGDDLISGGPGVNTLDGGADTDTLFEFADLDFTLPNSTLTIGPDVSSLSNFEDISLTGGESDNILDASTYTLTGVILDGDEGDDTLIGTANDDLLTGGLGADSIAGGDGNDTLFEENDSRFILTDTTLDMGDGTTEVQTVTLTGATAGTFTLQLDTETTLPIRYNASADEVAQFLRQLTGIGEGGVRVTQDITNEVQTVTLSAATSGTFTLTL
ncbi:MAG: calcium-binding protein, partial [Lysobacterales bacterium]